MAATKKSSSNKPEKSAPNKNTVGAGEPKATKAAISNSATTKEKSTKKNPPKPAKATKTEIATPVIPQNAPTKKRLDLITAMKARLEREREDLLKGLQRKDPGTEISTHGDLVDQSTTFSEQEVMLGMAEHDRQRLHDINMALDKIAKGTYGICEMSGELISDERLMAMPTARYSVKCQAKIEGYG